MSTQKYTPRVLWSQRSDSLLVTVDLQDVKDPKINISDQKLTFEASLSDKVYQLDMELASAITPGESKYTITPRSVKFHLVKAEAGPFWVHLLKAGKVNYVKADWATWKDEDEQDEAAGFDTAGFSGMDPNMFGGAGGMDFESMMKNMPMAPDGLEDDDDEDDLPDLEAPE